MSDLQGWAKLGVQCFVRLYGLVLVQPRLIRDCPPL